VSFDYHVCWDGKAGINGRGHTTERHDAHYMVFNTKTGVWSNVEGETLSMPLIREDAEQQTLALSTGDEWTFNGTVKLDSSGFPHIATNYGEDLGHKTGGPKLTHHIRWDGQQWSDGHAVNGQKSGLTRGDFKVTSPLDVTYILSDTDGSDGIITTWISSDGGVNFTQEKELLRRPKSTFAMTAIIKNAHPDAQVIVAERSRNTPHRKIYLLGENGPVGRLLSEATLTKDASVFAN
jgi:hypothetical protein